MTLVIIPARMASTRLPGKPLLKIGDRTIIERCAAQVSKAGFPPFVATDSQEIADSFRGKAPRSIMTGDCASGTDRVAAAAEIIDPEGKHEFVINYQGDMPFLDPEDLKDFVAEAESDSERPVTAGCLTEVVNYSQWGFARTEMALHIGLYGFPRKVLREFAKTPEKKQEKAKRLEQLRLPFELWRFVHFPSMPIEINTQADLDRARSCLM